MKVFKFGGASVQDASGIQNLAVIVGDRREEKLLIVVSALGKTTNRLEELLRLWVEKDEARFSYFEEIRSGHLRILEQLALDTEWATPVFEFMMQSFDALAARLRKDPPGNYDRLYDDIVSLGELWSSRMIGAYLLHQGILNSWVDIRQGLITDHSFRNATVDYAVTGNRCRTLFDFDSFPVYITQGFIGATPAGETTTLGREGSDFTAALLAYVLDAEEVTVWKDVPGILDADPRWMTEAEVLPELSYQEIVELSFFGAKVIHPKTVKPLHNKAIPLYVKSFINPGLPGTVIRSFEQVPELQPVYVRKENQILISLFPQDIAFALEDELVPVFRLFAEERVHINLVQTSAVTITVCADYDVRRVPGLLDRLRKRYRLLYNQEVLLLSIRHFNQHAIKKITEGKEILIEQKTRKTVRYVVKA